MAILLKDILMENIENRINVMALNIIMEKMIPEIQKSNATKLSQICTEVCDLACKLNETPYTIHNAEGWKLMKFALWTKLMEMKEEAQKVTEIDTRPLLRALDEVISN